MPASFQLELLVYSYHIASKLKDRKSCRYRERTACVLLLLDPSHLVDRELPFPPPQSFRMGERFEPTIILSLSLSYLVLRVTFHSQNFSYEAMTKTAI